MLLSYESPCMCADLLSLKYRLCVLRDLGLLPSTTMSVTAAPGVSWPDTDNPGKNICQIIKSYIGLELPYLAF